MDGWMEEGGWEGEEEGGREGGREAGRQGGREAGRQDRQAWWEGGERDENF